MQESGLIPGDASAAGLRDRLSVMFELPGRRTLDR